MAVTMATISRGWRSSSLQGLRSPLISSAVGLGKFSRNRTKIATRAMTVEAR